MVKLKDLYYNIIYGIQNIFLYFSVIWRDRNWDSHWIFVLLRRKLQLMSKNFEKWNRYEGVEKDVKKMRFCIKIIDRLIEDDYFDPKGELEKKWGKHNLFNYLNGEDKDLNDNLLLRERVKNREDEELYNKELMKHINIEEFKKKRDLRLLFKTLEFNIENWWD